LPREERTFPPRKREAEDRREKRRKRRKRENKKKRERGEQRHGSFCGVLGFDILWIANKI